eukprot:gene51728-58320_t
MAPEVMQQIGHGWQADIWSLGCTVMEMLTADHPWAHLELGQVEILRLIVDEERPLQPPEGTSDASSMFLRDCLQRDPEQRPTAQELIEHHYFLEDAEEMSTAAMAERGWVADGDVSALEQQQAAELQSSQSVRQLCNEVGGELCESTSIPPGFLPPRQNTHGKTFASVGAVRCESSPGFSPPAGELQSPEAGSPVAPARPLAQLAPADWRVFQSQRNVMPNRSGPLASIGHSGNLSAAGRPAGSGMLGSGAPLGAVHLQCPSQHNLSSQTIPVGTAGIVVQPSTSNIMRGPRPSVLPTHRDHCA